MDSQTFVIAEMIFFFGGALAFCLWQVWDARRALNKSIEQGSPRRDRWGVSRRGGAS